MKHYRAHSARLWDRWAELHVASKYCNVAGFKAGKSSLKWLELQELGPVRGRALLHLQCHFGLDTLSWAREGAHVTGIEFSRTGIHLSRQLAWETGLEASFKHADVYNLRCSAEYPFDIAITS